jgi:hypothetical protein
MNFAKKSRGSDLARMAFTGLALFAAGCGYFQKGGSDATTQKERDQKTREDVANAVENAKPKLEEAGRQVGAAAKTAADDAQAAAQGIKEGWERGTHAAVDVNSASEPALTALPGISHREARKIIVNRPYADKHELVSKGVLTEDQYAAIRDNVTAK